MTRLRVRHALLALCAPLLGCVFTAPASALPPSGQLGSPVAPIHGPGLGGPGGGGGGTPNVSCGQLIQSSITLNTSLTCPAGASPLEVVSGGVTVNLGGHTVSLGSGSPSSDLAGILVEASNVTITNGTVSGFPVGIVNGDNFKNTFTRLTLTNNQTGFRDYGAYEDPYWGGTTLANSTISGGVTGIMTSGTTADTISNNIISNEQVGYDSGGDTSTDFAANKLSNMMDGVLVEGGTSNSQFTDNTVNDAEVGFCDPGVNPTIGAGEIPFCPAYGEGNQHLAFVGNQVTNAALGYVAEGTATYLANNGASDNSGTGGNFAGFLLVGAFDIPNGPVLTLTGSDVTNNTTSGFACGICDFGSFAATYSGNRASNGGYGMFLEVPWEDHVTGNTADGNALSGLGVLTMPAFDPFLSSFPIYGPFSTAGVSNNTANNNGADGYAGGFIDPNALAGFGMWSDYSQYGGGNAAANNTPFNCFNISCSASSSGGSGGGGRGPTSAAQVKAMRALLRKELRHMPSIMRRFKTLPKAAGRLRQRHDVHFRTLKPAHRSSLWHATR